MHPNGKPTQEGKRHKIPALHELDPLGVGNGDFHPRLQAPLPILLPRRFAPLRHRTPLLRARVHRRCIAPRLHLCRSILHIPHPQRTYLLHSHLHLLALFGIRWYTSHLLLYVLIPLASASSPSRNLTLPKNSSRNFAQIGVHFSTIAPKGAESLSKSNIKALPFISKYKWAATISVLVIFLIEIVCNILRVTLLLAFAPVYISTAMLFIVTFTLVVCYLSAAIRIGRRIGHHGKSVIRRMTLRIALSSLGYIIIIIAAIVFAAVYHYVWGRSMPLNAIFVGFNLASIMQVLALKPIQHSSSQEKHSSSTPSAPELSNEQGEGVVEEEEHSASSNPS